MSATDTGSGLDWSSEIREWVGTAFEGIGTIAGAAGNTVTTDDGSHYNAYPDPDDDTQVIFIPAPGSQDNTLLILGGAALLALLLLKK